MAVYSITEVIEQAVQTEKLGAGFYADMAGRFAENAEMKKLFDDLAAKERVHEKTFAALKAKIKDETIEGWEEFSNYLRAIVESAFFIGKDKALTAMQGIKNEREAVDHAIGFEKESLLYYIGLRGAVKEKDIIDEIIDEEKSHISWLVKFRQGLA